MTRTPAEDPRRHKRLIDEGSLWIMVAAPCVWAAHFLLSYWIAAVWCAKAGAEFASLDPVRPWILGLTVAAWVAIALLARHAVRRYGGQLLIDEDLTEDTEPERERFLGHATLLLAALSALAVLFDTIPALVFDRCV